MASIFVMLPKNVSDIYDCSYINTAEELKQQQGKEVSLRLLDNLQSIQILYSPA